MAEKKNLMTYEGLKKLEDELRYLKTEKRNEAFEFIYCFRNADEAEGKRVPATATTRKYVD